jgi:hypothetical protein
MKLKILTTALTLLLFVGCSSKKYFEPKETYSFNQSTKTTPAKIIFANKDGATLENYQIINKNGISKNTIAKGYNFLNKADNKILASDKKGHIMIDNHIINLKNTIVSATIKDNLLALVFEDNTIALYDLDEKKYKIKEKIQSSALNDIRMANPLFLDDIVIFPTLNGKIILVNYNSNKIIKKINIDENGQINNIIFLKVINDVMVVATPNKLLSIAQDSFNIKDYEISDIIIAKNKIYLSTIDGNIMKLNLQLEKLASRKFKFAKIYSLGFGTSLYALESQDFLIRINENFTKTRVYKFDFDENNKTIAIGDTLYFDDKYIKLK